MPKTNAERQRNFKAREKTKLLDKIDDLLDDVDILVEWQDGRRVVTFDMGVDTHAALEVFAQAQGKTLDQILRGVMGNHIQQVVKLRRLKAEHNAREAWEARTAEIATLREEQAKLLAEIAELEAARERLRLAREGE